MLDYRFKNDKRRTQQANESCAELPQDQQGSLCALEAPMFLCSVSSGRSSNHWALCLVSDSFPTASSAGWLVKKTLSYFSQNSLYIWVLPSLPCKAPLSTANTDLPPQNLRHMFNNSSLFHAGYFTLTPHFRGRLLQKHGGPFNYQMSVWERASSATSVLIGPWVTCPPSPMLHIPVKTMKPDAHIGDAAMIYLGLRVERKGQRVMQIFNDTC